MACLMMSFASGCASVPSGNSLGFCETYNKVFLAGEEIDTMSIESLRQIQRNNEKWDELCGA